jgi:hypothetical protein
VPEVELQPVRRRGGWIRDRGAVVAVGIVILILVGVLKPWSSDSPQEPPVAVTNVDTEATNLIPDGDDLPADDAPSTDRPAGAQSGAVAPTRAPGAGPPALPPAEEQQTLTLVDVRNRAADESAEYDVFSAVVATLSDTARVAFLDDLPAPRELGSACAGGAMLGEGVDTVGITTETLPVTGHELVRLFNKGGAVPISVMQAEAAADGFVLRTTAPDGLPVGHYALILRAYGGLRVVPVCVGRIFRLVDHSLVKSVPRDASGARARDALFGQ